jgi:RNA polymerase sigma-70 factor, ECF subfamily
VGSAFSAGSDLFFSSRQAPAIEGDESERVAIIRGMSLERLSDEELAIRYRDAADSDSRELCINELFRRNFSRVARWCLRFVNDRETAADLAQEIFTKAYQHLNSFQAQSKFSTWLFSIARNHCLNAVRANMRQATELREEVDEQFLGEIPDGRSTPYDVAEHESDARMVSELLNDSLDETERNVFTLHYGEDMPLEAITRILRLENQSGAKAYIVSAKRKLARLVQQRAARDKRSGM